MARPPQDRQCVRLLGGDQPDAAAPPRRAADADLDFLTLRYLARCRSPSWRSRAAKDPAAGYARDFVEVVQSLVKFCDRIGGKTRVVTNAGGLDRDACGAAVRVELVKAG